MTTGTSAQTAVTPDLGRHLLPAVDRLLVWADEVFNFHSCNRASNGRLEGRMNKLGVLKRTAYGFVNPDHFAARAVLISPGMASSP